MEPKAFRSRRLVCQMPLLSQGFRENYQLADLDVITLHFMHSVLRPGEGLG